MRKLEYRQFDCFAETNAPNSLEDLTGHVLCCYYLNEVKARDPTDRAHHLQYPIFDTMKRPNVEVMGSYPNRRIE